MAGINSHTVCKVDSNHRHRPLIKTSEWVQDMHPPSTHFVPTVSLSPCYQHRLAGHPKSTLISISAYAIVITCHWHTERHGTQIRLRRGGGRVDRGRESERKKREGAYTTKTEQC